jgi:dihydrofolate reductase
MRRIVMFNRVTPDGYFSGPDGKLDWVVPDPVLDRTAAEAIGRNDTDTVLFGRRTYDMFESFWPHVLDESPTSPDPHHDGRKSPEIRAMAVMLNDATKLVFSRTRTQVAWKNSRLIRELNPRDIEKMKTERGKDMIVFGSSSIVSQLTEHGLIDEYQFVVNPILLGNGRSLIHDVSKTLRLDLVDAKTFPSGNVMLRYARRSQDT